MKKTTKLRLFGGLILLVNLWAIGEYKISGFPAALMTVGFAVAYELFIVRLIGEPSSQPSKEPPVPTPVILESKSSARAATTALRIVRGIFGFIGAFQVIGLFPVLTWMTNPSGITGPMLGTLVIKIIALSVCLAAYVFLRKTVNKAWGQRTLPSFWSL